MRITNPTTKYTERKNQIKPNQTKYEILNLINMRVYAFAAVANAAAAVTVAIIMLQLNARSRSKLRY